MISLILSDVVNNDLNFIASGPTAKDYTTPQQCFDLLETFELFNDVPQNVLTVLNERAGFKEFKKTNEFEHNILKSNASFHCKNVQNVIIGSNVIALKATIQHAESQGFGTYLLSSSVVGDAEERGQMYAMLINYICRTMLSKNKPDAYLADVELDLLKRGVSKKQLNDISKTVTDYDQCNKPICLLAAGETTVEVKGSGVGGRNQHMVLSTAITLDEIVHEDVSNHFSMVFLSGGTDGQDGPTDAAGAVCDNTMVKHASKLNLNAKQYLRDSDSYTFFSNIESGRNLLKTGLTGTNVMDLQIILIAPVK